MTKGDELLEKYREAAEALHDALIIVGSQLNASALGEYDRRLKVVEKCHAALNYARLEFKGVREDLKRSG